MYQRCRLQRVPIALCAEDFHSLLMQSFIQNLEKLRCCSLIAKLRRMKELGNVYGIVHIGWPIAGGINRTLIFQSRKHCCPVGN